MHLQRLGKKNESFNAFVFFWLKSNMTVFSADRLLFGKRLIKKIKFWPNNKESPAPALAQILLKQPVLTK